MFPTDDRLKAKAHSLVLRTLPGCIPTSSEPPNSSLYPELDTHFYFHSNPHTGPGNEVYERINLKPFVNTEVFPNSQYYNNESLLLYLLKSYLVSGGDYYFLHSAALSLLSEH